AWGPGLSSCGPDGLAGAPHHPPRRTRTSALAPARRVVPALEVAQQRDRRGAGPAELDHLAEPAAEFARTAGALPEFTAIEHHGSHALGRFHRNGAHARWERGRAEPIFGRPCPGPAAVEDHGAEFRQCVRVRPLFHFVDQRAAAEYLRVP